MADSTLDGGAVAKVAELAQAAQEVQYKELEDGRLLADQQLSVIYDPDTDVWPGPLEAHSLTGIIDYLEKNPDELDRVNCVLVVAGPTRVMLASQVFGPPRRRARHVYAGATARTAFDDAAFFDTYHELETMMVALQSRFQDTPERAELLRAIGGLQDAESKEIRDDGVSQKVTVKSGVSMVGLADVPNPVNLRPFRTFPEIAEQPESNFVVRVRPGRGGEGIQAALFEADGGAWRQLAVNAIRNWLERERDELVGDHPLIVA